MRKRWECEKATAAALITRFSVHDARRASPGKTRWHRVEAVGNGLETLNAPEEEHFDLVFMDVQMPEMDGMEATAAIREEEKESERHQWILCADGARDGGGPGEVPCGRDGRILDIAIRPQQLDEIFEGDGSRSGTAPEPAEIGNAADNAGKSKAGDAPMA